MIMQSKFGMKTKFFHQPMDKLAICCAISFNSSDFSLEIGEKNIRG